jgi:hypothetical protein
MSIDEMMLSPRQLKSLRQSAAAPGRPVSAPGGPDLAPQAKPSPFEPPSPGNDAGLSLDQVGILADPGAHPPGPPVVSAEESWNPIEGVPADSDVEVQVSDSLGRYALLFPCRLVPGLGWINALSKRRLAIEPVGWRPWLEQLPDFR